MKTGCLFWCSFHTVGKVWNLLWNLPNILSSKPTALFQLVHSKEKKTCITYIDFLRKKGSGRIGHSVGHGQETLWPYQRGHFSNIYESVDGIEHWGNDSVSNHTEQRPQDRIEARGKDIGLRKVWRHVSCVLFPVPRGFTHPLQVEKWSMQKKRRDKK